MRTSLSFLSFLNKKVLIENIYQTTNYNGLNVTYDLETSNYYVGIFDHQASTSGISSGDVVIPPSILIGNAVLPCVGIVDYCFYQTEVELVTIPSTVQIIGNYAFCGCSKLSLNFILSDVLTSIGAHCFENCTNLGNSFTITSSSFTIGEFALSGCISLTSVDISGSTSIPQNLLSNCLSLNSIHLPKYILEINETAFYNLPNLQTITLSSSSTSTNEFELSVSNNILYVSHDNEYELVKVPALFSGEISLQDNIISIWKYAFQFCSQVSGIISIPNTVVSIRSEAFVECTSISSISIGSGVSLIEDNAFILLGDSFISFSVDSANTFYKASQETGILTDINEMVIICVPPSLSSFVLPQAVTKLMSFACANLKAEIELLDLSNVTEIGENCFYLCENLKNVVFSNDLSVLKAHVFDGCSSLISVTFPQNLNEIGEYCFHQCTSLSGPLILPQNLFEVKAHSFESTSISCVFIRENLIVIDEYAFSECSNLQGVFDPGKNVEVIYDHAFDNCGKITHFNIHEKLTVFNFSLFNTMTSLQSISVDQTHSLFTEYGKGIYSLDFSTIYKYPNALTQAPILHDNCNKINEYCFFGSSFTCGFILPFSITEIGPHSFENSNIQSINFVNPLTAPTSLSFTKFSSFSDSYFYFSSNFVSLRVIGAYAFQNSQIQGILDIPSTVQEIGQNAFYNCQKLTIVSLGTNSNIGSKAFASLSNSIQIYYCGSVNTTQIDAFDTNVLIHVQNTYQGDTFLGYNIANDGCAFSSSSESVEYCQTPIPVISDEEESEIESQETIQTIESESESETNDDNNDGTVISGGVIAAIVICVILIIAVAVLGVLYYLKKKKEKPANSSSAEEPKTIDINTKVEDFTGTVPTLVTKEKEDNETFDEFSTSEAGT